jgi:quercetin dioxygenase-like cupin family protein
MTRGTPGFAAGADPRARLAAEGFDTTTWSNRPGDAYVAHDHGYDKVLVVVAGSIVFGLPGQAEPIALGVGDRLDLPAGTVHDAHVGPSGVTCLEAHAPAGTLPPPPTKRLAGEW